MKVDYFIFLGVVEIDECCITSKRKGLVGRFPGAQIWVFGMFSRQQKIFYVEMVANRRYHNYAREYSILKNSKKKFQRTNTLFPIIREKISPNTTIISDEFSVYVSRHSQSRFI